MQMYRFYALDAYIYKICTGMNIHELTVLNVRTGLPFTKMHA